MLDRQPVPVRPQEQRQAVRPASDVAGPERLTLSDVGVSYGPKEAVRVVSLSIHQGEVLALIGPSGCGKTTLLRTLNRLTELTPTARGPATSCSTERTSTTSWTPTALAGIDGLPAAQPVPDVDLRQRRLRAARAGPQAPGRKQLEPLVIDALQRAGLYDEVRGDLDRPALRLSGGQQQRLCIARAIAMRPEVLLMDEPCSALDPISTGVIEELIGELRRDLAVVIVTHNLAQAHRVADKVAFMYLGDLVEYGTTQDVFEDPRAERTREYVQGVFG